jgi:hypothetical protein
MSGNGLPFSRLSRKAATGSGHGVQFGSVPNKRLYSLSSRSSSSLSVIFTRTLSPHLVEYLFEDFSRFRKIALQLRLALGIA